MIQSNVVPPIDGIYLDYLRHKVDNQAEFDCRQKLKEAELQNFFMVSSKTVSQENCFQCKNLKILKIEIFKANSALIKVPFIFFVFEETV